LSDRRKIFVEVGRDAGPRPETASFSPESPVRRKYLSAAEKKVFELLEFKHVVPPAKWKGIGPEGRRILEQMVRDKDEPFRTKAITALVISEDKEHVRLLQRIISDKGEDNLVRSVAAISLGMSKNPVAKSALLKFVNDKDEFVRAKVVEALGKVGRQDARDALLLAVKDRSPLVSSNARSALRLMEFRFGRQKAARKVESRDD
jgi:hypothetical protein